jgi:hypothetical protein
MRHFIVNYFYVNNIRDIETIDIFLTLIKLNLKRKKYPFSTHCIENLEESIKTYDESLEKTHLILIKILVCIVCLILLNFSDNHFSILINMYIYLIYILV